MRLTSAAGARGTEHLTLAPVEAAAPAGIAATGIAAAGLSTRGLVAAAEAATRQLAAGATRRAAARIAELAIGVELLLARAEGELHPAIGTGERPVGHRIHEKDSFSCGPSEPFSP